MGSLIMRQEEEIPYMQWEHIALWFYRNRPSLQRPQAQMPILRALKSEFRPTHVTKPKHSSAELSWAEELSYGNQRCPVPFLITRQAPKQTMRGFKTPTRLDGKRKILSSNISSFAFINVLQLLMGDNPVCVKLRI